MFAGLPAELAAAILAAMKTAISIPDAPFVMSAHRCAECGAIYEAADGSCAARFETLLALDHARREPWGSRHGQAFAAFTLQHPTAHAASLDRAWAALHRLYVGGDAPARVFSRLVAGSEIGPPAWSTPPRLPRPVRMPAVTIADLADFEAATYAERLDAWCRAALVAWGARVPAAA